MHIEDLIRSIVEAGASDIHLTAPYPPVVRIDGELIHHNDLPNMTNKDVEQFFNDVTNDSSWAIRRVIVSDVLPIKACTICLVSREVRYFNSELIF